MALTFPSNPTVGQTYTYNGDTYTFDGKRWTLPVAAGGTGGFVSAEGNVNSTTFPDLNDFTRNAFGYINNASGIANYPQSTTRNGMLLDISSYGMGGTQDDIPNERAFQLFAADTVEDAPYWRVKQGSAGWHTWHKMSHDYAIKEGPASYASPYITNWSYGYDNGTSFDATSDGTGIIINESGWYHVTTYQRSGGADMYTGLSLNGDRTTLENRAEGLWGHDHAGYGGGWSHSIYIGPLNAGEKICAGTPTTQTAQYSTTGYSGGIYIVRIS